MNLAQSYNCQPIQVRLLKACLDTARAYIKMGQLDEAEELYDRAILQAGVIDEVPGSLMALVLLDIYDLYEKQGRLEEARRLWSRIQAISAGALKCYEQSLAV